ncbi:hypothetical protein ACFSTC_01095 [Nonomuraea ferruginea]
MQIYGLGSQWSQVAAFTSAIDTALGKWLVDVHRIGLTEYRALAHLTQAPDKELRVNDLAQKIGLNQSSATRLVSRAGEQGRRAARCLRRRRPRGLCGPHPGR